MKSICMKFSAMTKSKILFPFTILYKINSVLKNIVSQDYIEVLERSLLWKIMKHTCETNKKV